MIREALEFMFTTGRNATDPVVKPAAEPPHVYFLRKPDETLEKVEASPAPCAHVAHDLTTVVELAGTAKKPAVWYSREGVVLVADVHTRRDRAMLPLALSEQVLTLASLQKAKNQLTQADLVRLLRITFRGCLGPAGNLVEIVRRVKFRATDERDTEIKHGSTSLGKHLTAQVTGTDTLPEYVSLDVPVFAAGWAADIRARVECALEPDPMTNTFQLIPVPQAVEAAVFRGEGEIGSRLEAMLKAAELETPVYYGKP